MGMTPDLQKVGITPGSGGKGNVSTNSSLFLLLPLWFPQLVCWELAWVRWYRLGISANPLGNGSFCASPGQCPSTRAIMAQAMGIKRWCPNPKDCKVATQPMWSQENVPNLPGNAYFGKGCLDYDTLNNPEQFQITVSRPEHLSA